MYSSHDVGYSGSVFDSPIAEFHVHLDAKRRPTLPARVLREAELTGARELVVRADGPGRIVLEDSDAMLRDLQAELVAAIGDVSAESVIDSLLADRAADTSLAS